MPENVTITMPEGGQSKGITLAPTGSFAQGKNGGSPLSGEELPTERRSASVARDPVPPGEIRPFQGKNFRGWSGWNMGRTSKPSTVFRIEGEELVWNGHTGRIYMETLLSHFALEFQYFR